jgi:hypothetical protein
MLKKQSIILLKILLSFLIFSSVFSKLDKSKVLIAINCGGPEFTDSDGVEYIKVKLYYFSLGIILK